MPQSSESLDAAAVASRRLELGRGIRSLRLAAGLAQEGLALRAGVERKSVSRAETGTHAISLDAVIRLADALGISEGDLLLGRISTSPLSANSKASVASDRDH